MEFKKIFEDEYLLVVDKPTGLVVNRSITTKDNTLQDMLDTPTDNTVSEDEFDEDFKARSGIVHRLDKDTSGVLLVAKTIEAFLNLTAQFKNRSVDKEYIAVVLGNIKNPKFEVDAPLKRSPKNPFKIAVVQDGREAKTVCEVIKNTSDPSVTGVRVNPKTGRTHQIRVHLAAINHPIACDVLYNTRSQFEESQKFFNRLMLHAYRISFKHPHSGAQMTFEAELPEEFKTWI